LRDHGNLLAGVDRKARPIERRVTYAVRVEVAAHSVTSALCAVEPVLARERRHKRIPCEFGAEQPVPVQVLCPRMAGIKINLNLWSK
jgi:hypothetical protein